MTCEECEQILADSTKCDGSKGWIAGVSVLNLAKSHAQSCRACAAKMSSISKLDDGLDQLRLSMIRMEASARVERNLVEAFRRRASTPVAPFRRRLVWVAAAALVIAVAGGSLYSGLRSKPPLSGQPHRNGRDLAAEHVSPAVSAAAASESALATRSANNIAREKAIDRKKRRDSSVLAAEEFSLNGGGNVVRVTLPLSGLVAMGVPVHPEMSDRRVTADVALDPFGAVIAIHLVEMKTSAD